VRIAPARPDQAILVLSPSHSTPRPRAASSAWAEQACLDGRVTGAGKLALDTSRLAADAGYGPVPLTRLEFLLLKELAEHGGRLVPRARLLASVWGFDFDPGSNVVDACVRRVRSKLGFGLIKTVRGEGYQLTAWLPQ